MRINLVIMPGFFVLLMLIAISSTSANPPAKAIRTSTSKHQSSSSELQSLCYVAEVEQKVGGDVRHAKLLYDGGKFRCEQALPTPPGRQQAYLIQVFDGGNPEIVWGFESATPSAWPTLASCLRALALAVKQESPEATQQRYGIPSAAKSIFQVDTSLPLQPDFELLARVGPMELTTKMSAAEQVAGHICRILETNHRLQDGTSVQTRLWVEPLTRLVLRREEHIRPAANSPVPPTLNVFVVKTLRLQRSIPISEFQLPHDATANVPLIFKSAHLPPWVKRVPATGPFAACGIDFGHPLAQ